MRVCHKCGTEWVTEKTRPHFKEYCETCSAYLHCCKNCKFYDTSAPNQCYIPNTETVADRNKMNYCDEFEFRDGARGESDDARHDAAMKEAKALWGDEDTHDGPVIPRKADEAKDAFDGLFGKD